MGMTAVNRSSGSIIRDLRTLKLGVALHNQLWELVIQTVMVVGYNGILSQDVGSVTKSLWNFHKTSITYKTLEHYHKAPALGCIAVRPPVHKKTGR